MIVIAASVVLFNPDESVAANIQTYLPHVERLIIVDNSTSGSFIQSNDLGKKIFYIKNEENFGIAKALDQACEHAANEGYNWLLTMDQDSSFDKDQINTYLRLIEEKKSDNVCVLTLMHDKKHLSANNTDVVSVDAAITSGSVINLKVWREIGGFNEKLFIDEVDHEYCYRAKLKGYSIICFPGLFIDHSLGEKKNKGYGKLLAVRERTVHNPRRVYFMTRNYLYVRKRFRKDFKEEFKNRDKQIMTTLKNNLFFSGHFAASLRSIIKGYLDYRKLK